MIVVSEIQILIVVSLLIISCIFLFAMYKYYTQKIAAEKSINVIMLQKIISLRSDVHALSRLPEQPHEEGDYWELHRDDVMNALLKVGLLRGSWCTN